MTTVQVKGTKLDGRRASATVVETDIIGDIRTYDVHTNNDGEGLWINGSQTLGTCQFSVSPTVASAYAAFKRYFQS